MKEKFKMRWLLIMVLMFVFSLFLAACGGGTDDAGSNDEGNDDAETEVVEEDEPEPEPEDEGEEIELVFSHFFPPTHFMEEVVQELGEELKEATNGRITLTSFPGASLAAPNEHFDAAATGSVDIALSVHGYTPNEFPLSSVMELPFMSSASVKGSNNLWDLYNEFSDDFGDEYAGTVPLWLYTTDPGQLFTVGKPVKSIEDLKGMRIRSPSAETSEWLEALGATPVSMPMNENFEALERGVVDGTIAPSEAIKTWSLDEVIDYGTIGNFYSTTMFVVMNEDVFNSLSAGDQEILRELTGKKLAQKTGEIFDQFGKEAIEQATEKGIEMYELSADELEEWGEYINPTIEKWITEVEGRGLPGQIIYDRAVEMSN